MYIYIYIFIYILVCTDMQKKTLLMAMKKNFLKKKFSYAYY